MSTSITTPLMVAEFVPARTRTAARARRIAAIALRYAVLLLFTLLFMFPLIWAVATSLKTLDRVYEFPPRVWVDDPQWSNYAVAMEKLPFTKFILNSTILSVSSAAGLVFSSSLVGFAFARLQWRGRNAWFVILLATMMLPGQVLLIPHYLIFQGLGWVNTYKPLIVPSWLGGAFFIFLFRQFFKGIPKELEEAARIDGASIWQIYWRIYIPNAKPVIVTVAIMSLIASWNNFMGPLIYLSDFERFPISLGLHMYRAVDGAWVNYLMAASVVALLPLVVLFFAAQRYFTSALLLSGSKG